MENEQHFVLECIAYREQYEEFFLEIKRLDINLCIATSASNRSKWHHLLNSKKIIIKTLIKYGAFCYLQICLQQITFQNIISGMESLSNSLDPDQAKVFVWPDQGPKCLQRLTTSN